MNYTFFFDDGLFDFLLKAKEKKKIKNFDIRTKLSLKVELEDLNRLDIIHKGIKYFMKKEVTALSQNGGLIKKKAQEAR